MVRILPNSLIHECSGYFLCLCVVYWFVNAFVHQNAIDFLHKNSKICIYRYDNHLTTTYSFGKLAIWQTSFRKLECLVMILKSMKDGGKDRRRVKRNGRKLFELQLIVKKYIVQYSHENLPSKNAVCYHTFTSQHILK